MNYAKTAYGFERGSVIRVTAHPRTAGIRQEHSTPSFTADIGALDAPDLIPRGSCYVGIWTPHPVQSACLRDYLDAYDYTDRSAVHTDCASVPK